MSYSAIEQKLHTVPEECLDEIATFIDFVLFRQQIDLRQSENKNYSQYFGSIKTFGDGLELQRKLRDEWT